MAMAGPLFPTTNAVFSGTGLTSPSNANADDGVYATCAPGKNAGIGTKYGTFGFDAVIPASATINAVTLEYQFKVSTTSSVATANCLAVVGGTNQATHSDATEPTADKIVTIDVTADRSWTRSDLLDGTFEVALEGRRGNSNTAVTFSFDYVKVTVDYATSVTFSPSAGGSSTVTSSVVRTRAFSSTANGSATVSATVSVPSPKTFSPSASGSSTTSASVARTRAFGVSASGSSLVSASMAQVKPFSPSVSSAATVNAVLTRLRSLVIAILGAASVAAEVVKQIIQLYSSHDWYDDKGHGVPISARRWLKELDDSVAEDAGWTIHSWRNNKDVGSLGPDVLDLLRCMEEALKNGTSYVQRTPSNDKLFGHLGPVLLAQLRELERQVATIRP